MYDIVRIPAKHRMTPVYLAGLRDGRAARLVRLPPPITSTGAACRSPRRRLPHEAHPAMLAPFVRSAKKRHKQELECRGCGTDRPFAAPPRFGPVTVLLSPS